MRIVFMGTPDFAVNTLDAIYQAGHEIVLVVTQPDKPKGRSGALQMSDVKKYAAEHGLEVFQPVRIREEESAERLRECGCELIVVAAFGQILTKEILDMPKYGCINVHASLLPRLRGASPIQTAILEGDRETGVTIQRMGEGLDTGDIISARSIPIEASDTGGSLFDKLAGLGASLAVETIAAIAEGRAVYTPQDEGRASYARKIDKSMGHIDWTKSAGETERLVRALDPWPSAFTFIGGKMLKIWKAEAGPAKEAAPGTVAEIKKDGITVSCGEGSLIIRELQLEGKKRMSAQAFLLGYPLKCGTVLDIQDFSDNMIQTPKV